MITLEEFHDLVHILELVVLSIGKDVTIASSHGFSSGLHTYIQDCTKATTEINSFFSSNILGKDLKNKLKMFGTFSTNSSDVLQHITNIQ